MNVGKKYMTDLKWLQSVVFLAIKINQNQILTANQLIKSF